jgi:transcriptional regulator with XRE-family HTH domain
MSLPRKDNQFLNDLAERLKALRKKRKLSQMRVTMDTGINIGRVESGKRMLSVYSVAILCSYYGVSMEEFFRGMKPLKYIFPIQLSSEFLPDSNKHL